MANQETIGAQEMAQRLGVTTATIYNYIDRGIIPSQRVRRGLSHRLVVLRVDFEAAIPRLTGGVDQGGTMGSNTPDERTPALEALLA